MLKQKTKVIEAGGAKYRLGKMDARSASYLAMKAAAVIAPAVTADHASAPQSSAAASAWAASTSARSC